MSEEKVMCEKCFETKNSRTIRFWFGLNVCLKCRRKENA